MMFYEVPGQIAPRLNLTIPRTIRSRIAVWVVLSWLTFGTTSFSHAQTSDSPATSSPAASSPATSSPATEFPAVSDNEPLAAATPLPPPERSAAMIGFAEPDDFTASVFAAEPDVRNPIAMAWDHRGQLWVAENYTYANSTMKFRDDLRDRVVVFTDDDQDGTPEQRTVFIDNVSKLTSVEVGRGGVWLMCPPRLLFFPDADNDMIPDGPPETVLDGFTVADLNYHNFANGLRFGPDGWLYGRCGGSCPGNVGRPGTSDDQRIALEGGIWRYNVDTHRFEVICHGTTNPWGHDFNEIGELFFINTVNGHLWHGIHGAHFTRPFSLDPNLDTYELIDQHADHYHFDTTGKWNESRDGVANEFGGGHAHCGMMIYQDHHWPAKYRGTLMTLNFHGRRANVEHLIPRGTGYVGTHGKDLFVSDDVWYRGMELSAGPDGNVFLLDWSDLGECHEHTGVHRNSGRIYKLSHQSEDSRPVSPQSLCDLIEKSERFEAQDEAPRWLEHQSRLRLVQFAHEHPEDPRVVELIARLANGMSGDLGIVAKCRRFWTLSQINPEFNSRDYLFDESPVIRGLAIRHLTQHWPIDDCYGPTADSRAAWPHIRKDAIELIGDFEQLGLQDSPPLRLIIASTLQRLPGDLRTAAAEEILRISDDRDAGDHNQAKMIWYGVMSVAAENPESLLPVIDASRLPGLTQLIARGLGEQLQSHPDVLEVLFRMRNGADWNRAMLAGLVKGTVGIRGINAPQAWSTFRADAIAQDADVEPVCDSLDKVMGKDSDIAELIALIANGEADVQDRSAALSGWIEFWRDAGGNSTNALEIVAASMPLIGDARVNLPVAQSLATIPRREVAELLLKNLNRFRAPNRPKVISLLCVRPEFASVLLDRIEKETLPKEILTASQVRDINALGDSELTTRLEQVWGKIQATPKERLDEIERLSGVLTQDVIASADRSAGRSLYDRTCANCHILFGTGERVGPDLTGAQRSSLDYLLHNIIDPDAVVGADYRARKILTVDGRLLVGLVTQRTRRTLTLASAARMETIPTDDIEQEFTTDQSPMPSGLFGPLSDVEIANLIGYLMSPTQVPLPSRAD